MYMYMNTRQKTKGGTSVDILHFTSQTSAISATEQNGFLSKCAEHVIRRTVLAMALQQEKRLSIPRHCRTDRRQRSLQLREDALRLGHRYDQRSDDQHSAVGRCLET